VTGVHAKGRGFSLPLLCKCTRVDPLQPKLLMTDPITGRGSDSAAGAAAAAAAWSRDKLEADCLLRFWVGARGLLVCLPQVLAFWVRISTGSVGSTRPAPMDDTLSMRLLAHLHRRFDAPIHRAVCVAQTAADTLEGAPPTLTAHERLLRCRAACVACPHCKAGRVRDPDFDADRVLVPMVLGGSVVLTATHADRVADALARDDDVGAMKLFAVYAQSDMLTRAETVRMRPAGGSATSDVTAFGHVLLAPSVGVAWETLPETLATLQSAQPHPGKWLYCVGVRLGCLGPAVFSASARERAAAHLPPGFVLPHVESVALQYARFRDAANEADAAHNLTPLVVP
jgi:hypothetical protein